MRLKVPFYGFALALIGFLVPLVVFAAFLPSLINAGPVKTRFVQELQSWTGGDVELHGPVSIESFFSLSLNASKIVFRNLRGVPGQDVVKADHIIARISWLDLLQGRLDFDKIKIDGAIISARFAERTDAADTIRSFLTSSHRWPFEAFILTNARLKIDSGNAERPSSTNVDIKSITLGVRGADGRISLSGQLTWAGEDLSLDIVTKAVPPENIGRPLPLRVKIKSRHMTGGFKGEAVFAQDWSAGGQLDIGTPNVSELFAWLDQPLGFRLQEAAKIAAIVEFSGANIDMQSGIIALAGQEASGGLSVTLGGSDSRIEGALAFDTLDLGRFWTPDLKGEAGQESFASSFTRFLANANLDLRISTNTLRWDGFAMGSAALALSGRAGVLQSDIARLELFGGSLLGYAEADLRVNPPRLRARVTAESIDAESISQLTSQSGWIAGKANANIEAEAAGWSAEQLLDGAKATARIEFPEGGRMRLDPLQLVQSATAAELDGWESSLLSWWSFSYLRFDLVMESNRLQCDDLILTAEASMIQGGGNVDLVGRDLDWRLKIQAAGQGGSNAPSMTSPDASLLIKGPWARPSIRLGGGANRAGATTFVDPDELRSRATLKQSRDQL